MKRLYKFASSGVLALCFVACASAPQQEAPGENATDVAVSSSTEPNSEIVGLFAKPKTPNIIILDHGYFVVRYDLDRKLARQVRYTLTSDHLRKPIAKRKDNFRADSELRRMKLPAIVRTDYESTYDKGHLAPSADFAWSQDANDATFFMSNMVPQAPKLNRDAWGALEDQVRLWACGEGVLTVISGPILKGKLSKMKSGLEIPASFYKIVIDESPPKKVAAFIYYQTDTKLVSPQERLVPVTKVLELSGEVMPDVGIKLRAPAAENSLANWASADCIPRPSRNKKKSR